VLGHRYILVWRWACPLLFCASIALEFAPPLHIVGGAQVALAGGNDLGPGLGDLKLSPDSAACPAGPPAVVFMIIAKCPDATWSTLFSPANSARFRDQSSVLTVASLKRALASRASMDTSMVQVAGGMFRIENGSAPDGHVTESGSGFVIVTRAEGRRVRLRLCEIQDNEVRAPLVRATLGEQDLVVTKISFDGEPYLIGLRARTLADRKRSLAENGSLNREKSLFEKDLASHAPHSRDPHLPVRMPSKPLGVGACADL
jgi:hypothetical protein